MSKNPLSKQQSRRIQASKQHYVDNPENLHTGLIICRFSNTTLVECLETGTVLSCDIRKNLETLVCGDQVLWDYVTAEQGVICALLPRNSLLSRTNKAGQLKPLAANIDQIIITLAVKPTLSTYLLDCYLSAAEALSIKPIILLNKCDLLDKQQTELEEILNYYRQCGYDVLQGSAKTGTMLKLLEPYLAEQTSIFVGQSGVGKSTLINCILPEADITTRKISEQTELGTHSTTTSRLYHLKQGGSLIDSPGVREFGLGYLPIHQVQQSFIEFRPYLSECKFRNCAHEKEPGCALLEAIKTGKIAKHRLEHMHKIIKQFGQ